MPDCSLRRSLLVVLAVSLVGFAGCSGKKNAAEAPTPPEKVVATLHEETIREARSELERGEALVRQGEWQSARLAFDGAVDVLLTLPGGVESDPEAKSLYDDIVATIHEVERDYLAEVSEEIDEPSETAAVDELTTDVSLMESAGELEGVETLEDLTEADVSEAVYDIPIELNARVLSIIEMFQREKRDWFQEALDRGAPYLPLFRQILSDEGIPQDLVYLAMVESAFKTRAVSRAGARGMWQFIGGTGKLYGLRQDYWVDDRFDPEKATRAAARHLKDLHDEFGDWYLAMAAYNCGARRIERAIRRSGERDFWTLAQRRFLPRETRSYVPLILAATVIAKNPEAYGFLPPDDDAFEYDVVELDHPVDLETAAKSVGGTSDDLKLLNPELRHWVTPLDREAYSLKVPKGTGPAFQEAIAAIPQEERVKFGVHVVQRGDTLSGIARRYGTSIAALTSANRITARSVIHPGQTLTVPVPPGALSSRERFFATSREAYAEGDQQIHVVVRGDTLGAIAQSFRMSLDQLRELNDIPPGSSRIHPGQKLVVAGSGPRSSSPSSRERSTPIRASGDVYVVQSGDTLGAIADAHGVSLSRLRGWNGMSSRATRIYPGQRLLVADPDGAAADASTAGDTSGTTSYRIRRGDTLTTIARRFGVSVEELRRWNQMDSDTIVVGQSLTIQQTGGTQ